MTIMEISFYEHYHFGIIISIIFICGFLGGCANYFLSKNTGKNTNTFIEYIVLGIVASFTVPLFLNMICSNLIEMTKSDSLYLLVLIGFCLIASVFSRTFLENIYNKLIKDVKDLKKKYVEIKDVVSDSDTDIKNDKTIEITQLGLTKVELNIMDAMNKSKYFYRGITGLEGETKYPREDIRRSLSLLMHNNYILQTFNSKGQKRWYLSNKGKEILSQLKS